jgi:hypothetical protein
MASVGELSRDETKIEGEMDDLARVWKKACEYAKRRGFGDESEDFASWLVEKKLAGQQRFATLEQSFMGYSSELRANKRLLGSPEGYLSKNVRKSFDTPIGDEGDDGATLNDVIGVPGDDMELRSELGAVAELVEEIIGLVQDRSARDEIKRIYFLWLMENS